jgi:nucleotide-binding universal stress UspA family protein
LALFKDILLPVDLEHSGSWRKSLPLSITLCRMMNANLHTLAVIPEVGPGIVDQFFPEDFEKTATTHMMEDLHAFTRTHVPADIKVQHIVAHGRVYDEILRVARNIASDLIIIGAHRPDLKDYLIGSNASRVVRHATCSVLIARD